MSFSKSKIFNAIGWNSLSTVFNFGLVLVQMYILLRLLDLEDFGIVAIINAVFAYVKPIHTLGATASIVHDEEAHQNREGLSTFFWMLIGVNAILAIVVLLTAPAIAHYFDSTNLTLGLRLFSITLFFNVISVFYKSLFMKEMEFKKLFRILSYNKAVSFIIVISLAYYGWGYLSIIIALVFGSFVESALCLYYGWKRFKPAAVFSKKHLPYYIQFGGFYTGNNILSEFRKNIDLLLVGKVMGLKVLGFYSVLKNFLVKPYSTFNPLLHDIAMPWMSKLKDDSEKLRKIYFLQLDILCFVLVPVYAGLIVVSNWFVPLYFGDNFGTYIGLFRILCFGFLIGFPLSIMGTLIVSKGIVRSSFYTSIVCLVFYLMALAYNYQISIEALAWALVAFFAFKQILSAHFIIGRGITNGTLPYLFHILKPILIGLTVMAFALFASRYIFQNIAVPIVLFAGTYIIYYMLVEIRVIQKKINLLFAEEV